jgi:hypothetical protein
VSLVAFMDALVLLEAEIDLPDLQRYRWQPPSGSVNPPTLYNFVLPSKSSIPATNIVVDDLRIGIRLLTNPSDVDEEQARLETYFDELVGVVDLDLIQPSTSLLRGTCHEATRTGVRQLTVTFDGATYLAWEFTIAASLRRLVGA